MKKLIALLLLVSSVCFGQTFDVQNLAVHGTNVVTGTSTLNGITTINNSTTINSTLGVTGITTLTVPLAVTSGGIGTGTASGTALDNITGFSSSGFMSRTGAGAYSFTGSTGNGNVVLSTNPVLTTPNLGTPSSVTLTNGTGLPVSTGVSGLGTGVAGALGISTNTANGIPLVVGSITNGDCLKWNSGIQDNGSNCIYDANVVNVRNFGALGNSNGTHGNGNDDTTAFQNALNAAPSKSLFIPCGTYRITVPLTITDANPRWIFGNGQCTQIYSDQSSANATFFFGPAGTCGAGSNSPCLVMANLVFLTPNTVGAGQSAVSLSKTNSPYFDNVTFIGQQIGVLFANSFAPRVHNSRFYGGVAGLLTQDISFNSGEVWSNSFFNMTQPLSLIPASGCAVAVSIRNNDIEQNSTAMILGGICSGDISNNYIEASHTQLIFNFSSSGGGLQNITFYNNSINGATDVGTGTEQITNLLSSQFVNNSFFNWTVTYGSGVGRVRMRASENYLVSTTLPTVSTGSCTGLGTGGTCSIVTGDDWSGEVQLNTGTGPSSAGNVTLNFSNALGPNHAHCNWLPIANGSNWTVPISLIGGSGATTSTVINWNNGAALTASSNVLLGYVCQGY